MDETLAKSYPHVNSIMRIDDKLACCYASSMKLMDIKAIRRSRLEWLAERYGGYRNGGFAGLARFMEKEPNYYSQLYTGHRNMGHNTARSLELAHGLPAGTMDTPLDSDVLALLRAALGDKALDPGMQGNVEIQPRPINLGGKKPGDIVALKGKERPKEGRQPAPRSATKQKKRGAR